MLQADGLQFDVHLGELRPEGLHPAFDSAVQKEGHRQNADNDQHDECDEETNDKLLHSDVIPVSQ
jgi:hypothetical protein